MKKLFFLLSIFAITLSCSSDETSTPVAPPAPIVKYTITLSAGEGGTVSTTGGEYEAGQTVSVTATPQGEYLIKDWSDGNTNATRTITVSLNSTLTANFEKKKYPLTVNIEGEGEVLEEIVNAGSRTTDYDSGTTVKLTAVPAEGWEFVGWTGELNGDSNPQQILVNEQKNITASFKEITVNEAKINIENITIKPWDSFTLEIDLLSESGELITPTGNIDVEIDNSEIASYTNGSVRGNFIGATSLTIRYKDFVKTVPFEVNIENELEVYKPKAISIGYSETSVQVNPTNKNNIVASANFGNFYSKNGGETWSKTNSSLDNTLADPNVKYDNFGTVYRQGMALTNPRSIGLQKSSDGGVSWGDDKIAYKPSVDNGNPDQGFMAIDTISSSRFKNSIYIITSDYPKPPYTGTSYSIKGFALLMLISRDGGETWLDPIDISSDELFSQEHSSYVTIGPNGEVYAAWKTNERGIRFSKSLDGGVTWTSDLVVDKDSGPQRTSDDVRGNITIKVDLKSSRIGKIYISSLDNGDKEQPFGDSYIISSNDGGSSWSNKVYFTDGPKDKYKYYFQPRIDVAPNGRIDAVWYDTRNWEGNDNNNLLYDLYYSYSSDGGQTFSSNVKLNSESHIKQTNCDNNQYCGQRRLYEYIGLHSENERVIAVWAAMNSNTPTAMFSSVWHKNQN